MDRAKTAIIHRVSPQMSIVHPWIICFDLPMPHEVFDLLNKEILGLESNLVKEKERQSLLWTPRRRKQWSTMLKSSFWEQNVFMDTGIRMGLVRISQQWIEDASLNQTATSFVFWRILEANNEEQISGNCLFHLLTSSYITWPILPKIPQQVFP